MTDTTIRLYAKTCSGQHHILGNYDTKQEAWQAQAQMLYPNGASQPPAEYIANNRKDTLIATRYIEAFYVTEC